MPILLFTADRTFLGSLQVRKGTCTEATLTPSGEGLLKKEWDSWLRRGIPLPCSVETREHDHKTCHLTTAYTPLTSPRAVFAVEAWAGFHKLTPLLVPNAFVPYWEGISTWPMEPIARFEILFGLLRTERQYLPTWNALFEETQHSFQALETKTPSSLHPIL